MSARLAATTGLAALALALPGCGGGRAPNDSGTATSNTVAPTALPEPADAPSMALPPDAAEPGPRNAFIICPGNPRCPPDSGRPKGSAD